MKSTLYLLGFSLIMTIGIIFSLRACTNVPWAERHNQDNHLFVSYVAELKSMDCANSFYSHEGDIIDQIYEPILGYEYLERPYKLRPLLAAKIPEAIYYGHDGKILNSKSPHADEVAKTEYLVTLKKGIKYQPHPCFSTDSNGAPLYIGTLDTMNLNDIKTPMDFPVLGTRELKSIDFANGLKRVCDFRLASPVLPNIATFLVGMDTCNHAISKLIQETEKEHPSRNTALYPVGIDYSKVDLPAVEIIDDYTFKVVCSRKFPQTLYWMAMHFFAPVPQEAIDFYSQIEMIDKQITLNQWPIGTGPFMMTEYQPTRQVVLKRNPNYRTELYPNVGESADSELGLLRDAGKKIPFVDGIVFSYEREFIPSWTKFLQGYFDTSGLSSDALDKAISMDASGDMGLSDDMIKQGINLATEIQPAFFYFAFNMDDNVVGGYSEKQSKLRQAISIALNYNLFIEIFLTGRAKTAQSALPPGIYGTAFGKDAVNPYTDVWDELTSNYKRLPIERAKTLMKEAGFEGGLDENGRQLVIYLDHASGGNPGFKAQMQWYRHQLAKLGIDLRENPTDLNRYRDKIETGHWQTTMTGWVADYPDPENFFFLFYGPNSKTQYKGSNTCNYKSKAFDEVFDKLESMDNGVERLKLIGEANEILRRDAPICFGFNPTIFTMYQGWLKNFKPHSINKNVMQYYNVDTAQREVKRVLWNKPETAPILWAWFIFLAIILPPVIWRLNRKKD